MKLINNKILEAINKGINIALDDFEDEEILSLKVSKLKDENLTELEMFINTNFVDLGLPSRTLWAKCNLGAKTEIESGDYYAWGELESNKSYNSLKNNYRFYDKAVYTTIELYTKYNKIDLKTLLDLEDDIAYLTLYLKNLKANIPTVEQCEELINKDYTIIKWFGDYKYLGIAGAVIISKINGNYIFIPAAGLINEFGKILDNEDCYLWTKTLSNTNSNRTYANFLYIYPAEEYTYYYHRYATMPIRPVLNLKYNYEKL